MGRNHARLAPDVDMQLICIISYILSSGLVRHKELLNEYTRVLTSPRVYQTSDLIRTRDHPCIQHVRQHNCPQKNPLTTIPLHEYGTPQPTIGLIRRVIEHNKHQFVLEFLEYGYCCCPGTHVLVGHSNIRTAAADV